MTFTGTVTATVIRTLNRISGSGPVRAVKLTAWQCRQPAPGSYHSSGKKAVVVRAKLICSSPEKPNSLHHSASCSSLARQIMVVELPLLHVRPLIPIQLFCSICKVRLNRKLMERSVCICLRYHPAAVAALINYKPANSAGIKNVSNVAQQQSRCQCQIRGPAFHPHYFATT